MIEFDRVTVTYDGATEPAIRDVSFTIPEGELALVIGRTGSGKSTLLRTINGLVPHFTGGTLAGRVLVNGRDTREYRPRGSGGRLPWTFDLGANLTWQRSFGEMDLRVKFAVYNILDMQRVTEVDDELQTRLSNQLNPEYGRGTSYQSPRYGQLTVSLDF